MQTVFTLRAGVLNRLNGWVIVVLELAVFALPFSVVGNRYRYIRKHILGIFEKNNINNQLFHTNFPVFVPYLCSYQLLFNCYISILVPGSILPQLLLRRPVGLVRCRHPSQLDGPYFLQALKGRVRASLADLHRNHVFWIRGWYRIGDHHGHSVLCLRILTSESTPIYIPVYQMHD